MSAKLAMMAVMATALATIRAGSQRPLSRGRSGRSRQQRVGRGQQHGHVEARPVVVAQRQRNVPVFGAVDRVGQFAQLRTHAHEARIGAKQTRSLARHLLGRARTHRGEVRRHGCYCRC